MPLDLSKMAPVSEEEKFQISAILHAMLLEETFRHTKWGKGDAVFHGGTSLRIGWNSNRMSEDLDFMVSEPALESLLQTQSRIINRVRHQMSIMFPGSMIDAKATAGGSAPDRIHVIDVKWTHPNRRGKVLVKLEFYVSDPILIADYDIALIKPEHTEARVTTTIPIAKMRSLWGDKIKAIGTRPVFKHRDAYDLAYISHTLRVNHQFPNEVEAIEIIKLVSSIYTKTLQDVFDGLKLRLEDGSFEDLDEFYKNMNRWFTTEAFEHYRDSGYLKQMLSNAKDEAEVALKVLDAHLSYSRNVEP